MQAGGENDDPVDLEQPEPPVEVVVSVPVGFCGEERIPKICECWPVVWLREVGSNLKSKT